MPAPLAVCHSCLCRECTHTVAMSWLEMGCSMTKAYGMLDDICCGSCMAYAVALNASRLPCLMLHVCSFVIQCLILHVSQVLLCHSQFGIRDIGVREGADLISGSARFASNSVTLLSPLTFAAVWSGDRPKESLASTLKLPDLKSTSSACQLFTDAASCSALHVRMFE